MIIKHVALLFTVVSGAVSCAAGTAGPETSSSSGSTTAPAPAGTPDEPHQGQSGDPPEESPQPPAPAPAPASSEVYGTYSMDEACADIPVVPLCILDETADKDVVFTLPPGMKRSSIVYTVAPHGSDADGTVEWAGDDPLDGTVHMHAYAGAFSSVHIKVTGVMVVPQ